MQWCVFKGNETFKSMSQAGVSVVTFKEHQFNFVTIQQIGARGGAVG
jgi:hypothetical protein